MFWGEEMSKKEEKIKMTAGDHIAYGIIKTFTSGALNIHNFLLFIFALVLIAFIRVGASLFTKLVVENIFYSWLALAILVLMVGALLYITLFKTNITYLVAIIMAWVDVNTAVGIILFSSIFNGFVYFINYFESNKRKEAKHGHN